MHFGENQLSQSLIGLSPLTTGHPLHFQLKWVRASTRSYTRFTLPMARSLRFGSRTRDSHSPYSDSLSLRLPHNGLTSPRTANSQAHSSKGTPSPAATAGSDGLSAHGFRYSFTPLPGYFSPFPHGTYPLSVTRKYLALPGGPGRFTRNSTSSVLLGHTHTLRQVHVSSTGLSPTPVLFPTRFDYTNTHHRPVMLNRTMHAPQHPHSNTSTLDTAKV
jgi:hypothetical protein